MRKKILFLPSGKAGHPATKSILINPPKNIKIIFKEKKTSQNREIIGSRANIFKISQVLIKYLKSLYTKVLDRFKLPMIIPILPNKSLYYDYHLSNYWLILSIKKFIIYHAEHIGDIVEYKIDKLNSRLCLAVLKTFLLSNRCKYVFCMSEAARKTFIDALKIPRKKHHKFQVIYPTINVNLKSKMKHNKDIKLLLLLGHSKHDPEYNFHIKGGKLVLQAYEHLISKYNNLKLIITGYIPKEYKDRFEKLPGVTIYLRVTDEKLKEFYQNTDIFLFPTYGDGFGFTFIEAMSFGLPIICIDNHFTGPELVLDNITGFSVKTSIKFLRFPHNKFNPNLNIKKKYYYNLKKETDTVGLKNFIEKLEILIQNEELRKEFGKNGKERILSGDLSIIQRNRKLFELFHN